MTNVTDAKCIEYRRKEARNLVDKFNPMFEKLTEAMHKLENKLGIHANELNNMGSSLEMHMNKEEAVQAEMKDTIDKIHSRVTHNANTRVSKTEMRWIIGLLVAGFTTTAGYMITQLERHGDDMDLLNQKLYFIEATQ